jgi:outer membrane protein OmpA-like peptidoglycan-associated protein
MKIFLSLFFICLSTLVQAQKQFTVFFDSNKYLLKKAELDRLNQWISTNTQSKIVGVDGYCDEDGSVVSNDTLAKRRINFVYELLKNKLQIRSDFKSRNFGEQHQLSKIKAENRKVVLFYLEFKDLPNENKILGIQEIPKPKPSFPKNIVVENPDGTKSNYDLNVAFMTKISEAKKGEKLNVENLNFIINTFAIVPESRAKLYELLLVMENNPNLKISILGHLCCMPNDRTDLSTKRAKAIYSFLTINNIEKSRITYQGMGVTQPIYAIPEKSEQERAANRRVEIEILEN